MGELNSAPRSSTLTRRSRPNAASFAKQLQHVLGPKVATRSNFLISFIVLEAFIIVFLIFTVVAKNNALIVTRQQLEQEEDIFTRPPSEYNVPLPERETIQHRSPDEDSLFSLSDSSPRRCKIENWAYLGEKCFYRDEDIKDREGHNASIWSLVQDDWYYTLENDFACPVSVCRRQWKDELNVTREIVVRALQEHFQNDTPWDFDKMYLGSKYVRINPFWGLEYQLNGAITLTKTSEGLNAIPENKTAAITIRRGFTNKYCDVSVNTDIPSEDPVYVIVPFTGRLDQLRLFFENVKELVDDGVNLRVILSVHGGPVHLVGATDLLRELQLGITEGLLSDGHLVQAVETQGDGRTGEFSRSIALREGTKYAPADALLFFCDVDMTIKKDFFNNCRYNTKRKYQVYFPVVYSLYPYGYKVSREHGYWRKGAFGMVCLYKSDFNRTWAWATYTNQKRLLGWGFEDVMLYNEFTNDWQTTVFLAIEPNLLHRWHPKYCRFNEHVAACVGTVFSNMGSQQFLANIVAKQAVDVRDIAYSPVPLTFENYKNDSEGSEGRKLNIPAAEGETDERKMVTMKRLYEKYIESGKGGLLSLYAQEAQEVMALNGGVPPAQAKVNELASTAIKIKQYVAAHNLSVNATDAQNGAQQATTN